MKRATAYLVAASVLLAGFVALWFALVPPVVPQGDREAEVAEGSGVLDGMTFAGMMAPADGSDPVEDTFVFADGKFASTECDRRCGYPARAYFVRNVGERIEFVSESHCLYKDAKIVWRGIVDGDTIEGVSTWTLKRWYWTIEKELHFEGTLMVSTSPVASTQ